MSRFLKLLERFISIIRPLVVKPFYAIIALGLFGLGSTILVTNEGAIWQFVNCVANNSEIFGDGLDNECPFPPIGELTDSDIALAFGFIFILMSFIMGTLAIIVLSKSLPEPVEPTPPKPDPKPHTLLLPASDAYLHDIITRQLLGSDAEIKLTNISHEQYKQLIVMTGPQPGKYPTEFDLLKHLLTRLRLHEFGELELSQDGKNYRLTATPGEQGEIKSE